MKRTIALALALLLALTLASCGAPKDGGAAGDNNARNNAAAPNAQALTPGTDLEIPVGELTETAQFFPVTVEGTTMEILAVKVDGEVRTAFNTCQVCNGSPYAYFEQKGGVVECQNCRNQFPMSRVGVTAGGCNPWPIFEKDRTLTADSVAISYDFLQANKSIFANWKAF